jgi:predicted transcriptional regulator
MSTTTIRLPEALKARIAQAAERAGTTPHAFILQAIAEKAEREEQLGDFHETAAQREATIAATGMTVPWNEMRRYLEDRITGKPAQRPTPRKLGR